jgi:pilus assembly protein Flp/PilA
MPQSKPSASFWQFYDDENSLGGSRMSLLNRLWNEESGQDLVEYGLLLALVAVAAITTMKSVATAINAVFTAAAGNLTVS